MGKKWQGTYEEQVLFEEILRHPPGTPAINIHAQFRRSSWDVMERAGRTSGRTGTGAVYRHLCDILQNLPEGFYLQEPVVQPESSKELKQELKQELKREGTQEMTQGITQETGKQYYYSTVAMMEHLTILLGETTKLMSILTKRLEKELIA